jgi:hypothetical protein
MCFFCFDAEEYDAYWPQPLRYHYGHC